MVDIGKEMLTLLRMAPRYNRWIFRRIEPWLGSEVMEVGAGLGNLSQFLVQRQRHLTTGRLLLSDKDRRYVDYLCDAFALEAKDFWFTVMNVDVEDEISMATVPRPFDTIVSSNLLEHLCDDVRALAFMSRLLKRRGRLIAVVPALKCLYGSLDRELIHFRRYGRRELRDKLERVGLEVVHLSWMNMFSIPGWFLNGRRSVAKTPDLTGLMLFDRLVPTFRVIEKLVGPPIGQSLIVVAEKPEWSVV